MTPSRWLVLLATSIALAAPSAQLERAKAEPNLDRRSELALSVADDSLAAARKAYREADIPAYTAALNEVHEGLDLAREALASKGRGARNFKRAEQRSRVILRKLEDFAKEAALDDRPQIDVVVKAAEQAHTLFLNGVLRK